MAEAQTPVEETPAAPEATPLEQALGRLTQEDRQLIEQRFLDYETNKQTSGEKLAALSKLVETKDTDAKLLATKFSDLVTALKERDSTLGESLENCAEAVQSAEPAIA